MPIKRNDHNYIPRNRGSTTTLIFHLFVLVVTIFLTIPLPSEGAFLSTYPIKLVKRSLPKDVNEVYGGTIGERELSMASKTLPLSNRYRRHLYMRRRLNDLKDDYDPAYFDTEMSPGRRYVFYGGENIRKRKESDFLKREGIKQCQHNLISCFGLNAMGKRK